MRAEAAIGGSALHALDCSSKLSKLLMPRMLLHRGIERCCLELLLHAVLLQEGRYGDEVVELLLSSIGAGKSILRGAGVVWSSCRGCGC